MPFDPVWLIFLLIGIAMLLAARSVFNSRRAFIARAKTAEGTVIGLEKVESNREVDPDRSDNGPSYAPIVRFQAAGGQQIEFTDAVATRPARNHFGQKLKILYDPDNPSEARVDESGSLYVAPLALLFIGLVFTALGSLGLHMSMNKVKVSAAPQHIAAHSDLKWPIT
jgi:hypothetical protein